MLIDSMHRFNQSDSSRAILSLDWIGISPPNSQKVLERKSSVTSSVDYVLEGNATVVSQNTEYTATKGDTIIFYEGDEMSYYPNKNTGWQRIWLNVKGPLFHELARIYNIRSLTVFKGLDISEKMLKMYKYAETYDAEAFGVCTLAIHEIFQEAYNVTHDVLYVKNPLALKLQRTLQLYINQNPSMEEIAAIIDRSVSQTIKIFKDSYGITPYQYLLKRKLDIAQIMLTDTSRYVNIIARHIGFEDEFHFSKFFKKRTGYSPTEYRKKHQKNILD